MNTQAKPLRKLKEIG